MTDLGRPLIHLDGSPRSEQALRLAATLQPEPTRTTLLRVVRREEEAPEALRYLRDVAWARVAGPPATVLAQGTEDPARLILEVAARGGHDVVVFTRSQHKGLRRWFRSDLAERVLRTSSVPVLVGNPQRIGEETRPLRRILVPLDGGEVSAQVLPWVQSLCLAHGAEAALFRAVSVAPHDNVMSFSGELDAARGEGRAQLLGVARELELAGVQASCHLGRGLPTGAILRAATELRVDLIAMATHGRRGLERWLCGSVAEAVARACAPPALLVRAAGVGVAPASASSYAAR